MSLLTPGDYVDQAYRDAKGGVCIDAGSHLGDKTLQMLTNGATKVVMFEPCPSLAFRSLDRLAFVRPGYIRTFRAGVSDKQDFLHGVRFSNAWLLQPDGENYGYDLNPECTERFDVNLKRIDDLFLGDKIKLIKIDVDGYEYRAIRGARGTIVTDKPTIILELSMYVKTIGDNIIEFIDYLYSLPYRWFDATGNVITEERMREEYPYHSSCDIVGRPFAA